MDKKNMKVAVYFRTATVPIEQKVWLYASSKSSEQAEWRDLSVEAMKHMSVKMALWLPGFPLTPAGSCRPWSGPAFRKCWRLSEKDRWVR